nr:carbohydrate sulfotransferase 11-like [Ciona intestinalis]|eukprot:XP_009860520.1 carbohydrate sulfotransferase 11-like [Ciona intestinalis]
MSAFVNHRKKWLFSLSAVMLIMMYFASVWSKMRSMMMSRHSDQHQICDEMLHSNILENRTWESHFMRNRANIMSSRHQTLVENCAEYLLCSQTFQDLNPKLISSTKYNLMYCDVAKVASTNSKKVMLLLNKYVKNMKELNDLNKVASVHGLVTPYKLRYNPESTLEERTKNFTTFLVVRHPMERLVSAYEDKFFPSKFNSIPEMEVLGKKIMTMYPRSNSSEKYPTFEQFLSYLLQSNDENPHWEPYVNLCHPCRLHYDVIMHLDTVIDDSRFLLKLIHAPIDVWFPSVGVTHRNNINRVSEHLEHTDPKIIKKIEDRYNLDYKLFGFQKYSL